jgi:hypothetical protein
VRGGILSAAAFTSLSSVRLRLIAVVLFLCARAEAAEDATPDVQYVVPAACPDVRTFRERLDARVAGASKEAVSKSLRAITIRIDETPAGYSGSLVIRDTDGAASTRELSAPTCDEVVDAFAVLSALTMGIVASGSLVPPRVESKPPPARVPAPPPPRSPPAPASPRDRWRFSVGADVTIVTFVGPTLGVGPEPFVDLSREGRSLLSPAFRLSGARIGGEGASAGGGSASLALTALRLEGCPLRLPFARNLWGAPCLGVRAGAAQGNGTIGSQSQGATELWLSLELLARVRWAPWDWLVFEAQGGGSAPLFRYEFYFAPDAPQNGLYETPVLGAFFGGGVGVRIP